MSITTVDRPRVFKDVREAPAVVLFLIFVSEIGLNWLYVNFLYGAFSVPAFHTNGLVQPVFVLSFLKCAFIVLGILFWIGKFNGKHLGLSVKNLKYAVLTTIFLWSLVQICLIVIGSLTDRGLIFLSSLSDSDPLFITGSFVLFALTKALYDEIIYRGLVLPQFHMKIKRFINVPEQFTLFFAVVSSQILYLIIQLPLLSIVEDNDLSLTLKVVSLLMLSILNALIFLRTRNTLIAVGLHALWFYPLMVVEATIPHTLILTVLILGFIMVWPHLPTTSRARATWPTQSQRLG